VRPTLSFSSAYGRGLTVAMGVAGLAAVVVTVVEQGTRAGVEALAWASLVVLLVWALFWRPAVVVSDGEVVVRNVWRTTHVPWPAFRSVQAGLSLVVEHSEGTVNAWAAPGSSGTAARMRRTRPGGGGPDLHADRVAGTERTDDASQVGTSDGRPVRASGTAESVAAAVQARHDALVHAGHLRHAESARTVDGLRPVTRWHVRTLAAVLALGAAVAVATVV
jgi:hypothetical protein